MEQLEESIFGGLVAEQTTHRIYELKRDLIAIKRAVAPLIEVCNRLVRFDQDLIVEEARPYFRDVYDHVIRINESVDSIRDALGDALEANLSLVSIRQNETMKSLAAWAGIIAVPTMLAGIWGMNFEGMPELHAKYGYPVALSSIVGAAAVLYWRFKRAGWL
jgi:magnesium transporter